MNLEQVNLAAQRLTRVEELTLALNDWYAPNKRQTETFVRVVPNEKRRPKKK